MVHKKVLSAGTMHFLAEEVQKYLVPLLNPYFIFVFGSFAKGSFREDSDLDVAFLSPQVFSSYEVFQIAQGLASEIHRDVDLVNLRGASTVFTAQIVATGKVIYSQDEQRLHDFRIRSLKEYCLLNEERAKVLQTIKERGSIYGR